MDDVAFLRSILQSIADRDHLPNAECLCDYGDNGYVCGTYIAEKALKVFKEKQK